MFQDELNRITTNSDDLLMFFYTMNRRVGWDLQFVNGHDLTAGVLSIINHNVNPEDFENLTRVSASGFELDDVDDMGQKGEVDIDTHWASFIEPMKLIVGSFISKVEPKH